MVKKSETPSNSAQPGHHGLGQGAGVGLWLSWWHKSQFRPEPPSPAYGCQRVNGQTNSTAARNWLGLLYR